MPDNLQSMFRLDGKTALVSGASKGIGEAMARGLAEFGAKVVVSSRKQDAVDAVAEELRTDGLEATAIAANMGSIDDIQSLLDKTVEVYGGLDIIVNNAAANPVFGPVQNTDERAFDKIIDVNLKGPFELCKRAHPIMQRRGGGSIINISSIGGLKPESGIGIYSVSKAAIISLTQAMAQDWGADGIRVNAICPGLIKTVAGSTDSRSVRKSHPTGAHWRARRYRGARGLPRIRCLGLLQRRILHGRWRIFRQLSDHLDRRKT
jgi:NAD(P)-dependent dehydrogenase (short-subunit alcohol dehydrogenase family)